MLLINILKMQYSNSISRINLSENFPECSITNLIKVFPELNKLIINKTNSKAFSPNQPIIVDKYPFYQIILEKLKSYFELKETFVISDSISLILKDLKNMLQNPFNKASSLKMKEKNKTELPLLNRIKSAYTKENLRNEIKNKTCRNYSTKSNGGRKKVNTSESPNLKLNESFNLEKPNFGKINYVYLNLDDNEKPKMKSVHFADIDSDIETTRSKISIKQGKKKSNLKKTRKDFNKTINYNLNDFNKNKNQNNKKLFLKTTSEYPIRNKSNGIRFHSNSTSKEKYENKETIPSINKINIPLNEENLYELYNIDDKDFNIFEFEKKVGKENTLPLIGRYIFDYFNFGEIMNKEKFNNWCKKISEGYNRNNSYHTDLHAADVAHSSFIYFKMGLINEKIKLDKSSICALFLSCICHDYKHPGLNNNFLIETNNPIAINYNDISVLENMHISEAFKLIHSDDNYNIFENFNKNEYKRIRKQMISCVLHTDMSYHKGSLDFMNKILNQKDENIDQQEYMNLILHSADISNPTKKFEIYYKWAELVVEEFYEQGDKEKELGLNCSCDRNKVSLYKSQIGFLDYVVIPFYSQFAKVFPKLDFLYENANDNKQRIKLLEEEDNKNKEGKANN